MVEHGTATMVIGNHDRPFKLCDERVGELPETPHTATATATATAGSVLPYPGDAPPVLFGHYWFTDNDVRPSTPNRAGVDFSAVRGGDVVAYRWDGKPILRAENYVHA
jgi:hypothetical protein